MDSPWDLTATQERSLAVHRAARRWFRCRPGALLNPSRIVETVSLYIIDAKTCSRRRWWDLPANVRLVPAYFHQGSILDDVFHFSSFNSFCNNAPHFVNARYSWLYLLTVFPKDILQLHQALSYPSIFQVGPILKNCSKFLPTSSLPPIVDLFKIVQFSEFSTQSYASFWS